MSTAIGVLPAGAERVRPAIPGMVPQPESEQLSREAEARLIARAQGGDRIAIERLIDAHMGLVYTVARRYRCRSHSLEDLVQEGVVGLIAAIRRFDPSHGCRLNTYALHWVRQAIARAAELTDRMIHVPAQANAEARRLFRTREELRHERGREPSEGELVEATGISEERIHQLIGSAQDPVSLEALVGAEQDASILDLAEDPTAPNPEAGALQGELRQALRQIVAGLRPKERRVVEERFGLVGEGPVTLDELSRRLRISREGVRQIEARAIRKIRHALRSAQWE